MEQFSWIMPLLLMPGVGLLINSTSTRYSDIHDEIHRLIEHDFHFRKMLAENIERRAVLFRNALVNLYLSIMLFALGSVAGAVVDLATPNGEVAVTVVFSFLGMVSLMVAAVMLVRESVLSLGIFREHFSMILLDEDAP